ncbi:MAG: hypothetical protein ACD_11C00020G0055 [uncultured bacterium]|nr:MAG: hypothetical protein ACD_11C00020G0055 [uncultured bacterium]HBR71340.1 hypothetical protein [Candidatus Moranbacteria bacterium]
MNNSTSKKSLYIGAILTFNLLLAGVFVFPFLSLAKNEREIYVNAKATGVEDGSSENPYRTISSALRKAKKNDKLFVANGEYKENIEIPKGVKIYGADRDEVIIKAKNDDDPVVEMNENTKINKVTIKNGKVGIKVEKNDDDVSIIDCVIEKNKRDGIKIEKGSVSKAHPVSVTENVIRENGWNGIYSETRRVVLMENNIYGNDRDGVELAEGSSAWIEDNRINDNDGVGFKFTLDNSNIWLKDNSIRDNDKSGMEVDHFGNAGRVDISKSTIAENEKYGIARVQKSLLTSSAWDGFTFDNKNTFFENKSKDVSDVIIVRQ